MQVSLNTNEAPAPALMRSGSWTSVLAIGTFAIGTDAFIVAGFLPQLAGEFGVTETEAGYSVTVFAFCYAVFSPVLATLTATVPRRRLLVTALVVCGSWS